MHFGTTCILHNGSGQDVQLKHAEISGEKIRMLSEAEGDWLPWIKAGANTEDGKRTDFQNVKGMGKILGVPLRVDQQNV